MEKLESAVFDGTLESVLDLVKGFTFTYVPDSNLLRIIRKTIHTGTVMEGVGFYMERTKLYELWEGDVLVTDKMNYIDVIEAEELESLKED